MLTAYADTDVAIRAINDIGLDYYLLKPWDPPADLLYCRGRPARRLAPGPRRPHRRGPRGRAPVIGTQPRDQDVPGAQPPHPGELNQVWTNLVDNAVDAMSGTGRLRIGTRLEGDHVEVEDTGAGMPPEVAARAFEAFFTTKDVGHGTGLDIARRIVVERHRGTIEIDFAPGRTVMRVRLPVGSTPG